MSKERIRPTDPISVATRNHDLLAGLSHEDWAPESMTLETLIRTLTTMMRVVPKKSKMHEILRHSAIWLTELLVRQGADAP